MKYSIGDYLPFKTVIFFCVPYIDGFADLPCCPGNPGKQKTQFRPGIVGEDYPVRQIKRKVP
ncbi:hypothetical protein AGMMS50267_02160 [Spirochaetia bacterium]|nr:hypothetical protein AGMMS50267_02160 [Spirochaetia bacterium]